MTTFNYTSEVNIQIIIALLKSYGIKRVIASPGTTNITFVASIQRDPFFEIYSAPEERSAGYMAIGMAEESGEPVVLSCTGATASRNYLPAITEAFYRKIPLVVLTSTQTISRVGQLVPQVLDRSVQPNDTYVYSALIGLVKDRKDFESNIIKVNQALHYLKIDGGGPVHLNVETSYSHDFSVKNLPLMPKINLYYNLHNVPSLPKGKIGVYVGSHSVMSEELTHTIDKFCYANNAVVFCDDTSNYFGKFRFQFPLVLSQDTWHSTLCNLDLMIHIGEISGAYAYPKAKEIWRINSDGMIRSVFGIPSAVFKLSEIEFFTYYSSSQNINSDQYYRELNYELETLYELIPENLPFSNIWIAKILSPKLPSNSVLHLGILNSLRSWNFFRLPQKVTSYCNVGGFGIDGAISTTIGGALSTPGKIHYLIVGDLAFFYDLNSLGNRHVPSNLRILLINNSCGTEFKNYNHFAAIFEEEADKYVAACGHYGNSSPLLVKHYAEDLGFIYMKSSNKEEFNHNQEQFLNKEQNDKPIIWEVFTEESQESKALKIMRNLKHENPGIAKKILYKTLGSNGINTVKKIIRK